MANKGIQLVLDRWQHIRSTQPQWVIWAGGAAVLLLYYFLIIGTLDRIGTRTLEKIESDQKQVVWMAKASEQVLQMRKTGTKKSVISKEPTFTVVNQAINEKGWNTVVTDVHQVEGNKVQISFNAIAFNELMEWLDKMYVDNGVYVSEASMSRTSIGVIQASLLLQKV